MITLLLCLFSVVTLARECHQFTLNGSVTKNDEVLITINRSSNSQRVFRFDHRVELAMAPFLDKFVTGKFVFEERHPAEKARILSVEKPDLAIPDPLSHKNSQVYLGKTKCPL